jgi:MATE family multidrug resistance protein
MIRKIVRLAIPNIVSNVTVPLLAIADIVAIGHKAESIYLAAIALGAVIFNMIYWSFSFLRMGVSGLTAQSYGNRNFRECVNLLMRGLSVSLVFGILIIVSQGLISRLGFYILGGSETLTSIAKEYYNIRIFAAPATLSQYVLFGWFIGMQNSKTPMVIALSVNTVNIGLNFFFLYVLGMNADGIALSSVIAEYIGVGLSLWFVMRYYGKRIRLVQFVRVFVWKEYSKFFSINGYIFIRTVCSVYVLSFFTNESARMDTTTLAVNTILLQFMYLFSYFMDGFAYASEALVGKYVGGLQVGNLRLVVRKSFQIAAILAVVTSGIYLLGGEYIMPLFSKNTEIEIVAKPYLYWVAIIPLAGFAAYTWDGIYIGATSTKTMMSSMVIATFIVFLPAYYLTKNQLGNHALWLAFVLFKLARGAIQTLRAKKDIFRKVNNLVIVQ